MPETRTALERIGKGGKVADAGPPKPELPDATLRAQAQAAIANGKDPAAVKQRLKAWGVSTDGL